MPLLLTRKERRDRSAAWWPAFEADRRRRAAAAMRKYRKEHAPTPKQRFNALCRAKAGVAKRRGKLRPEACAECGSLHVEMHHPDYTQPLMVVWLCRAHHLALHA